MGTSTTQHGVPGGRARKETMTKILVFLFFVLLLLLLLLLEEKLNY
jgi:preprotein translocase subunit SecG